MNQKTRVISASLLGNALEFYDFSLYGVFALVIAQNFFPSSNKELALLYTLGGYAVGFFMRPLGSLLFGYIGDKAGRRKALSLSIVLMGIPTGMIGLIPTYEQIGMAAPILLLTCRLLQGVCLGGENNGSAIFLLEHAQRTNRGLLGGLILTGGAIGSITGTVLGSILLNPVYPSWYWRIPFLLGLLISLVGFYLRYKTQETPAFIAYQQERKTPLKAPLKEVLKESPRQFICAIIVGGTNGVLIHTLATYSLVYLKEIIKIPLPQAMAISAVTLSTFAISAPLMGRLGDKFKYETIMMCGAFIALCSSIPFYMLMKIGPLYPLFMVGAVVVSLFNGPTNAFLNTLFPVQYRYTGIAFGYAVGVALFGGTAPFIYSLLIQATGDILSPAYYIMGMTMFALLAIPYSKKGLTLSSQGFRQTRPRYSLPSN